MICTSLRMMNRVARIGASKMLKQGYSYSGVAGKPGQYDVFKPNAKPTDDGYRLDIRLNICPCMFWQTNRPHFAVGQTTCKHIEFVKIEEAILAHQEEIEDAKTWEGYGDLRLTGTYNEAIAKHLGSITAVIPSAPEEEEDESDPVEGDWDNIY